MYTIHLLNGPLHIQVIKLIKMLILIPGTVAGCVINYYRCNDDLKGQSPTPS